MAYYDNGPRAGRSTGRQRNTLMNNASKGYNIPAVPPGSAVGYGNQLGTLQMQLFQRLADIAAQQGGLRGQFLQQRAGLIAQRKQGIVDVQNSMLDRGVLGSSVDVTGRTKVRAATEQGIQAAWQQRQEGLLGLQRERLGAQNEYYSGVFNIMAQRRAEQAQMANQSFLQDLVLRMQQQQRQGGGQGQGGAANAAALAAMFQRYSVQGPTGSGSPGAGPGALVYYNRYGGGYGGYGGIKV